MLPLVETTGDITPTSKVGVLEEVVNDFVPVLHSGRALLSELLSAYSQAHHRTSASLSSPSVAVTMETFS